MPRIGTIATMPSRIETFAQVLPVIVSQVDQVFVFLDGFETIPGFLQGLTKVTMVRSQDAGNYHAAGRFLCLQQLARPSVVLSFDDDIHYPSDYAAKLIQALVRFDGKAVVGVHCQIFRPPFANYVRDRKVFHFADRLWRFKRCDELGAGTLAFCTDRFSFDVRPWTTFRSNDICVAIEAKKAGLPLWCIPRRNRWMQPFSQPQAFSIWAETQRDPREKTTLMRQLLAEKVAAYELSKAAGV